MDVSSRAQKSEGSDDQFFTKKLSTFLSKRKTTVLKDLKAPTWDHIRRNPNGLLESTSKVLKIIDEKITRKSPKKQAILIPARNTIAQVQAEAFLEAEKQYHLASLTGKKQKLTSLKTEYTSGKLTQEDYHHKSGQIFREAGLPHMKKFGDLLGRYEGKSTEEILKSLDLKPEDIKILADHLTSVYSLSSRGIPYKDDYVAGMINNLLDLIIHIEKNNPKDSIILPDLKRLISQLSISFVAEAINTNDVEESQHLIRLLDKSLTQELDYSNLAKHVSVEALEHKLVRYEDRFQAWEKQGSRLKRNTVFLNILGGCIQAKVIQGKRFAPQVETWAELYRKNDYAEFADSEIAHSMKEIYDSIKNHPEKDIVEALTILRESLLEKELHVEEIKNYKVSQGARAIDSVTLEVEAENLEEIKKISKKMDELENIVKDRELLNSAKVQLETIAGIQRSKEQVCGKNLESQFKKALINLTTLDRVSNRHFGAGVLDV